MIYSCYEWLLLIEYWFTLTAFSPFHLPKSRNNLNNFLRMLCVGKPNGLQEARLHHNSSVWLVRNWPFHCFGLRCTHHEEILVESEKYSFNETFFKLDACECQKFKNQNLCPNNFEASANLKGPPQWHNFWIYMEDFNKWLFRYPNTSTWSHKMRIFHDSTNNLSGCAISSIKTT